MCFVLEVSRSAYYAWLRKQLKESPRRQEGRELLAAIQAIHKKSRGVYGAPRIHQQLLRDGKRCGLNRVARIMRASGIRSRVAKKFRPATTNSNHAEQVAPNLLPEANVTGPDQVWAADITYIPVADGWVYLATVIDMFSRAVVGWSLMKTLKTELPLAALQMALDRRESPGLHHSDRGSQYASKAYRERLAAYGIESSMSRKGNCYDNATQESFFHSLKTELVHHERYKNFEEARASLFDYIEVFYNRQRLHSSLGYVSPSDFEAQAVA